MAKKTITTPKTAKQTIADAHSWWIGKASFFELKNSMYTFIYQAVLISIIGYVFYQNSFENEYALDDGIVIVQNEFVQGGADSIWGIFTNDAYTSFYRQMGSSQQLSGGRYRPLSIVTFAIEQELFTDSMSLDETPYAPVKKGFKIPSKKLQASIGVDENGKPKDYNMHLAHIRHKVNVFLYIFCAVLLLYFLRFFLFQKVPDIAFLSALLFLTHPIHTEAISNVKSRDEIMSLIFITLTFMSVFKYFDTKKILYILLGGISFFLALLSKEYAVTLIALIPIALYVFRKATWTNAIITMLPYFAVLIMYMSIRVNIVGASTIENPEVLNNPYLYAKKSQKLPTKISTASNYFKLLVFPHPLSSDYSYNQIPYKSWSHWSVWLSLLLHGAIIYYGFKYVRMRHPLGFAIMFYLAFLAMIANILMDIGATMGERLIFHSSLGFVIAASYLLIYLIHKISSAGKVVQTIVLSAFLLCVTSLYAIKSWERNFDWKNDKTLFIKDVEIVPNSVLVNGNAGARCIDLADTAKVEKNRLDLLYKGISYLDKATRIHPKYVNGFLNLGLANYKLKNLEASDAAWARARQLFPTNPYLRKFTPLLAQEFLNRAFKKAEKGDLKGALADMQKAVQNDSGNPNHWYHLGGAHYSLGEIDKAREAWTQCLKIDPKNVEAQKGLAALPVR
ncbi:MAG: tetratricopeptide repeat protein [Bacteroidetes bacterium]|nr:tetratricopeptide repeat protein [Bacteroidota bacterium]